VAVDAMGGDDAPALVVEGALLAARELGLAIELVGPIAELEPRLAREPDRARLSLTIVDAPERVGMADRPRDALRKGATSIRIAVERVRTGDVSGLFSAGHTGATIVAGVAGLGMLPGVDRPALAVTIPTARGPAVLLDVGATVDCRPDNLRQFAAMGCAYAQVALGKPAPRVGLLSIGEEAQKGDQLTRDAFRALETSGLPFTGNVEAYNLFDGDADVIVCDGFTGNIALKVSEGAVGAVGAMLREELAASMATRLGARLARPAFRRFAQRVDPSGFGGAPLLGVNGLCLVGHGRSSARAVRNGIALANRFAAESLVPRLADAVARLTPCPSRGPVPS
jgi:glycerol-3-phosphate acyltransferase PlsX